jgi:hypothetical protein
MLNERKTAEPTVRATHALRCALTVLPAPLSPLTTITWACEDPAVAFRYADSAIEKMCGGRPDPS